VSGRHEPLGGLLFTAQPTVLRLPHNGGTVTNVSLHRPSLDQAFLEYTGRSLRDAESSGGFDKMAASRASRRRR
jgi:ABC-2 type transport system ATP-binding protein